MRKYLLFAILSFCLWGGVNGQGLARLQAINVSADQQLDSARFWIFDSFWNDYYPDVPFLGGSVIDFFSAGLDEFAVTPNNSTNIADSLAYVANHPMDSGFSYYQILSGLQSPAFYAANPDGKDISTSLTIVDKIRESANNPTDVDLIFFHGVTDCQTIDIRPMGSLIPVVNDLQYSTASNYLSLPVGVYPVEITNFDQTIIYDSIEIDLTGMAGKAILVMFGGFVDPSANQNGSELKLCYVEPDGSTGCFDQILTSVEGELVEKVSVFPNPATSNVVFDIPGNYDSYQLSLTDITGKTVYSISETGSVDHLNVDVSGFISGLYIWTIQVGNSFYSGKINKN